jgi:chromosome segregation ATPase
LSVEGSILLDLRSKINNIEKQLAQKTKDLERASSDLKATREKLQEIEKIAEEKTQSFSETKKNYERAKEEKLFADAEITKFKNLKSALEKKIGEGDSRITELENNLKEVSLKAETLEEEKVKVNANLEKEKADLKEDLQQKENEIEDLKKELQTINSDKYIEIESLKNQNEAKATEIASLTQKLESLEDTISEAKGAPQLMEEVKDIMAHKGFLSDREFDDLLRKLEIK